MLLVFFLSGSAPAGWSGSGRLPKHPSRCSSGSVPGLGTRGAEAEACSLSLKEPQSFGEVGQEMNWRLPGGCGEAGDPGRRRGGVDFGHLLVVLFCWSIK